jgi:ribosomal protein L18
MSNLSYAEKKAQKRAERTAKYAAFNAEAQAIADEPAQVTADYAAVEEKLTKKSVWQRVKSAAKKVGTAIAKPFKAIGRAVVPAARQTAHVIATPFVYVARKPSVQAFGRFCKRNWGWLLTAAILTPAFIVAPIPTLIGTGLILVAYQMMSHDSWFVRAIGRGVMDAGIRAIVDGVFEAIADRRN